MEIIIREATANDLVCVEELTNMMELNHKSPSEKAEQKGFLVSDFSLADYQNFLATKQYFFVAECQSAVVGFILAYNSATIKDTETTNKLLQLNLLEQFVVVKQICVAPNYTAKGIGTKLYQHLFTIEKKHGFVAAIVTEPLNIKSIKFHEKRGFFLLCEVIAPPDKDMVSRPRAIYYRGPHGEEDKHPQVRIHTPNHEADITHLLEKLHDAVALYLHEDNLNWTKFGMLVTFMMAMFATFAFLWERDSSIYNCIFSLLTITFGIIINYIFFQKIKSGLMFMQSHKEKVKSFEKKLLCLNHNLSAIIDIDNEYISGRSKTVTLMKNLPQISFCIWIICSVLLLLKGLSPLLVK